MTTHQNGEGSRNRDMEISDSRGKVIKAPKEDIDAIQTSLTARRRMSLKSLLGNYKSQNAALKGENHLNPDDDGLIEDEEEIDSNEQDEYFDQTIRIDTIDLEAYQKSKGDPIDILRLDQEGIRKDIKNVEDELNIDLQKEYVWDVLFENQRGIYIFGKGYFSAGGLLPADPSAFTRPSDDMPSASSLGKKRSKSSAVNDTDPQPSSSGDEQSKKMDKKGNQRSNKTSYTLETFQPPLPDWEYVTPWMINMRTGTDELGWRYNAWFKKKGWSSHSGVLGWGGWVRRREWIRLRGVDIRKDHSQIKINEEERDKLERKGKTLEDILIHDDIEENVQDILVCMGKINLDRQRLELWERWLAHLKQNDDNDGNRKRLIDICEDEKAVSTVHLFLIACFLY
ncbi:uncharacterized protein I206_103986 [Kwoniella pini CBS 10737]|uniref:Peroxin domain-containing protein n=1 Tax=Kwoniella pini CBS 10737 TaxID=1296096 RepID=A0A1B9I2Z3_9TREE|nr:uncharacterized protein I206_04440 [Kwoniella pini CBS 10737]OCF49909.1 hypothetical protein I206_04440 [Kwoniella pini CBS 10737]